MHLDIYQSTNWLQQLAFRGKKKRERKCKKGRKRKTGARRTLHYSGFVEGGGGGRGGIAGSDLRSTSSASRQLFRNVPEFEQAIILIVQCFMFNNITRAEFLILADKWSFSLNHQDGNIDFEILFPFSSVSDRSILM